MGSRSRVAGCGCGGGPDGCVQLVYSELLPYLELEEELGRPVMEDGRCSRTTGLAQVFARGLRLQR